MSRRQAPDAPAELTALAARRIAIEGVDPEIDGGRFAAKAVAGRPFVIEADIFCDGHERIRAAVDWRPKGASYGREVEMRPLGNDRWRAEITFPEPGYHIFTLLGWRDLFGHWREDTLKKLAAGQACTLEAEEGRRLVAAAAEPGTAHGEDAHALDALLAAAGTGETSARLDALLTEDAFALMRRVEPRASLTYYERQLEVFADRPAAAFGAWYEMFPRSQGPDHVHGTFDDVIARLPYVRDLGFDVLYFTPIHPIGRTNRKGRNNSLTPAPDDPGSPYAIGSEEGGHDAIHPGLGTLADFDRLVAEAHAHGLEIALDFAIQCSPDHPWIREHPEWFDWRPDGTIKFAENPPKKYEDIVNVHFYRKAIPGLWLALRDVVLFWVEHGVKIFRVDNPHTKPFPFWEWMIRDIRETHPDVIFLSEAFTRPKVMKRLAKLGFSQSYTYFTWRNEKQELTEYFTELSTEECRRYMRPNLFPSTPDINPYYLQSGGRAGHRVRLALAATLAGNYGIYNGFEICEATPLPGREEYLDSEKYEIRDWDFDRPGHIRDDIRLLNRIRREHPAFADIETLKFYNAFDDHVIYYGRMDPEHDDYVLVQVNLNPHEPRDFRFEVPLWEFDLPDEASVEVEDLLQGNRFTWHGKTQWLRLEPETRPYAVWRLLPPGAAR
ncbi:MAG: maltotransferase domain-containing protein [Pseudomonadota bacterium]